MDNWDVFIDNALRGIVLERFMDNTEAFNELIHSTCWPKYFGKIKQLILQLNQDYNEYIKIFDEHSEYVSNGKGHGVYREIMFYKAYGWNKDYERDRSLYIEWTKKCYVGLHNFVFTLNSLIDYLNKPGFPR